MIETAVLDGSAEATSLPVMSAPKNRFRDATAPLDSTSSRLLVAADLHGVDRFLDRYAKVLRYLAAKERLADAA